MYQVLIIACLSAISYVGYKIYSDEKSKNSTVTPSDLLKNSANRAKVAVMQAPQSGAASNAPLFSSKEEVAELIKETVTQTLAQNNSLIGAEVGALKASVGEVVYEYEKDPRQKPLEKLTKDEALALSHAIMESFQNKSFHGASGTNNGWLRSALSKVTLPEGYSTESKSQVEKLAQHITNDIATSKRFIGSFTTTRPEGY